MNEKVSIQHKEYISDRLASSALINAFIWALKMPRGHLHQNLDKRRGSTARTSSNNDSTSRIPPAFPGCDQLLPGDIILATRSLMVAAASCVIKMWLSLMSSIMKFSVSPSFRITSFILGSVSISVPLTALTMGSGNAPVKCGEGMHGKTIQNGDPALLGGMACHYPYITSIHATK